jgi:uncharacterized protein (TIGR03437 family)
MKSRIGVVRILLVAALVLPAAFGQYDSIATDATGQRVWFATSRLLRSDSRTAQERIYEARTPVPVVVSEPAQSNEVNSQKPQVSDDGDVVAWTVQQRNTGPTGDILPFVYFSVIHRASDGKIWVMPIEGRMSRNGKWFVTGSLRFNLLTDEGAGFGGALLVPGGYVSPDVADDGAFLQSIDGELVLTKADKTFVKLPASFLFGGARMDRTASVVVGTESTGLAEDAGARPRQNIMLFNTATGVTTKLLSRCTQCSLVAISGDGGKILFSGYWPGPNSPASGWSQLWLLDVATTKVSAVTNEPADVKAGALSSDGFQVCYGAASGELRCVDTVSGQTRAMVGPVGDVRLDGRFYVPGARSKLPGAGLQNATVRLGGVDLPLLSGSSTQAEFVLPWNTDTGNVTLVVDQPASVFAAQDVLLPVVAAQPEFVTLAELGGPLDATADWPFLENGTRGGLVSSTAPLRPGEEVWIHMRGLGRDPSLLTWNWGSTTAVARPTSVEYEEYNPGWHVVKFTVPGETPSGQVLLRVKVTGQNDGATILIPVAAP